MDATSGKNFTCDLRTGRLTRSSAAQPGDLVGTDLELYLAADCYGHREHSAQCLHLQDCRTLCKANRQAEEEWLMFD